MPSTRSSAASEDPQDDDGVPLPFLLLRVAWIVVQATAAVVLADKATPFFYQQF